METFKIVSKHDLFDVELTTNGSFLVLTKISKNAYLTSQVVCLDLSLAEAEQLRDYLNSVLECGHEKEIG